MKHHAGAGNTLRGTFDRAKLRTTTNKGPKAKTQGVRRLALPTISLILCSLCISTQAEIYSWKDADGKMHYSDKKPEDLPHSKVDIEIKNSDISFATEEEIKKGKEKKKLEEIRKENEKKQTKLTYPHSKKNLKKASKNQKNSNDSNDYSKREKNARYSERAKRYSERKQRSVRLSK